MDPVLEDRRLHLECGGVREESSEELGVLPRTKPLIEPSDLPDRFGGEEPRTWDATTKAGHHRLGSQW